jgi:hypothetical protein
MNIFDLLHKRILIVEKSVGYNQQQKIEEVKILEISPSGKWVKIQNMNGNKFWKMASDIVPVEILFSIEEKPTT